MIYQDALCYIRERLFDTGYFQNLYEFCVMEDINGVTKPMYLLDSGNLIDVHNFDVNGSGYIRKLGSVNISRSSLPVVTACDASTGLVEIRMPLRGVFAVPTAKLGGDGYSSDLLAMELIEVFHGVQPSVSGAMVSSRVTRYETDRNVIYKEEVNSGYAPILELAYIYIDFELIFTGSVECFKQTCY